MTDHERIKKIMKESADAQQILTTTEWDHFSSAVQTIEELKSEHEKIALIHDWQHSTERVEWIKKLDETIGFWMENFSPVECVLAVRQCIAIYRLPIETSKLNNFETFAVKYKDLIVQ